ncbi:MFS general substrate transporter [Saccharata proteae CBS 121410]|uniref:MFS general substrate transporter n=1 Tax=Saccharata proteae CBS 121410 TaxID=1314787 RepID=A0A9P4HSI7_9PEZI|nr:MFS general substrate transporter [Saccharata proteae CBS 121410]
MSSFANQPRSPLGVFKEVFNWYPSEYSKEERRLLFKLDLSILIFACLCFFTKYLDQSNISNAYTSGMKEDLGLYGNQLNYFNVCYYTAYVISQVPMLLLISRPKLARWMLPTLEVVWGILTFAQSRVTNVQQLYALRFLVGMAEAPVFAGTHFILGSWYKGPELFKRAGTWFICNSLGSMVSGYLQSAAYTNLSGVAGMSGWRWLFIIDGIFTIPVALAGYLIFPGVPQSPKPRFLSDADVTLAKVRMAEAKVRPAGPMNMDVFKRSLSRWHIYVFIMCYIAMIIASYPTSYMNLWLKAEGYSVPQVNKLPTGVNGITVLSSWLGTTLAAIYPSWIIYSISMTTCIFSGICMTIWNIPRTLKFVAWYALGLQGCASPILYSTVNTILKDDAEERALTVGAMMSFGYSFNIWVPLLLYPTAGPRGAPRWVAGWPATIAFYALLWVGFIVALTLYRRE